MNEREGDWARPDVMLSKRFTERYNECVTGCAQCYEKDKNTIVIHGEINNPFVSDRRGLSFYSAMEALIHEVIHWASLYHLSKEEISNCYVSITEEIADWRATSLPVGYNIWNPLTTIEMTWREHWG